MCRWCKDLGKVIFPVCYNCSSNGDIWYSSRHLCFYIALDCQFCPATTACQDCGAVILCDKYLVDNDYNLSCDACIT